MNSIFERFECWTGSSIVQSPNSNEKSSALLLNHESTGRNMKVVSCNVIFPTVILPTTHRSIWQNSYSPMAADSSFVNVTQMTFLATLNNNIKLTEINIILRDIYPVMEFSVKLMLDCFQNDLSCCGLGWEIISDNIANLSAKRRKSKGLLGKCQKYKLHYVRSYDSLE